MARVVVMVVDGLRADLVSETLTPHLERLARRSRAFPRHRAVFPSATRVNSASIATGCYPARHGLLGNTIALDEGQGLVAVSVGPPTFRERWRRATGGTLSVPTLSQRLAAHGGAVIHSNSSAGAAHMQDPDGHGTLLHRDGSHGPGLAPITDARHPRVGYDADGDREVTERFCAALGTGTGPLDLLWICEPDHSQHVLELGSPAHRETLRGADACIGRVAQAVDGLRARGEDVLFVACSDHGHETVSEVVPVSRLMSDAGLTRGLGPGDLVLASSGMGALVFLSPEAAPRADVIAGWLTAQHWCARVFEGERLAEVGLAPRDALHIAFAMRADEEVNRFGIPGRAAVAADPFISTDRPGRGQHGGLGRFETNPFLILSHPSLESGEDMRATSAVDLAPTVLDFLGLDAGGMDGRSLLD